VITEVTGSVVVIVVRLPLRLVVEVTVMNEVVVSKFVAVLVT
jgi:hypothetical protein